MLILSMHDRCESNKLEFIAQEGYMYSCINGYYPFIMHYAKLLFWNVYASA